MKNVLLITFLIFSFLPISAASNPKATITSGLMKDTPTARHVSHSTLQQLAALSAAIGLVSRNIKEDNVESLPPLIRQKVFDQYCFLHGQEFANCLHKTLSASKSISLTAAQITCLTSLHKKKPAVLREHTYIAQVIWKEIFKIYAHMPFTHPSPKVPGKCSINDWLNWGTLFTVYSDTALSLWEARQTPEENLKEYPHYVLFERNDQLSLRAYYLETLDGWEKIANIFQVKVIDLRNNNLSSLPSSIGKIKQLKRIYLQGNPIAQNKKELKQLQQLLPNTKIEITSK